MKKMTFMMAAFVIFLVGCLLYIGLSIKKQNKPYTTYESDLVEVAKAYVLSNKLTVEVGQQYELTIDKMIMDQMLTEIKVNDDECDGKVVIKRTLNGYDYKALIKCSKYESIAN